MFAYLLVSFVLALTFALQASPQISNEPRVTAVSLSAGGEHSCAIDAEHRVHCWGSNRHGQLDASAGSYAAVSAGDTHTCAIDLDGGLSCWGGGKFAGAANPVGRFLTVSAGEDHAAPWRQAAPHVRL